MATGVNDVCGELPSALQDAPAWPDPLPPRGLGAPVVDDVSRLNMRVVGGVFEPRTEDDVRALVALAEKTGRCICVRGTQHSMGGHSIADGAIVIDTVRLARVVYDPASRLVKAQTGALWCDVIRVLNAHGMSPRTMQSYASFSVGGTLAVNAHGITTDHCIAESVVSFRLVKADGSVVVCARDGPSDESRELFALAIGGYGMFGIITEATMRVDENCTLLVHTLRLTVQEFPDVFSAALEADDVAIKLARLDLSDTTNITLFLFRCCTPKGLGTVSSLPHRPREMAGARRLLFKWLAPTFKELRFALENRFGVALDWNDADEQQRNLLMFESAEPLARLFEPLLRTDDTFVLQEFFVPRSHFAAWLFAARPILVEADGQPHRRCTLLNVTIRFVRQDVDTALPYAKDAEGMFAFVLYFRIPRTDAGDAALHDIHRRLTSVTLGLGGTFYLPYRHHYGNEDLRAAYPGIEAFWAKKEAHDPRGVFDSLWRKRYGPSSSRIQVATPNERLVLDRPIVPRLDPSLNSVAVVPQRRTDSFRRVMGSADLWRQFTDEFLTAVFNVEDPVRLSRRVARCAWNPKHSDDDAIYAALQHALASESSGVLAGAAKGLRGLFQLRDQKAELLRETMSILGHLGKTGAVNDYLSIGDHGKMVEPLRKALGMRGECVCAHDACDDTDMAAVVERGRLDPPDRFVFIDYEHVAAGFPSLAADSFDLVTINQGLHHMPQEQLLPFLRDVRRVLRPGGLLIVREHDCDPTARHPDIAAMLDVAHMVFNAVTGVDFTSEKGERRAFRPLLEWRRIVEAAGLCDTLLYEMQPGDPTWDEMMCFFKPPLWPSHAASSAAVAASPSGRLSTAAYAPPIALPRVVAALNEVPGVVHAAATGIVDGVLSALPALAAHVKALAASAMPGHASILDGPIDGVVASAAVLLERTKAHLACVELRDDVPELIPHEVFLALECLKRKAATNRASATELAACALLKKLESAFTMQPPAVVAPVCHVTAEGLSAVRAEDVAAELRALLEAQPDLCDPDALDRFGLSALGSRYAAMALQQIPEGGRLERCAEWLSLNLDANAWEELKAALARLKVPGGVVPLTLASVLAEGNAWHDAAMAVLGCPKVRLSAAVTWQLRLVGHPEVASLWAAAQSRRSSRAHEVGGDDDESAFPTVSQRELLAIRSALADLNAGQVACVRMDEGDLYDVPNVSEVVEARYDGVDATAAVRRLYFRNGQLRLRGRDITADLYAEGVLQWSVVGAVFGMLTWRTRRFVVRYRATGGDAALGEEEALRICCLLASAGLTRPLHGGAGEGHWTWFKLSEWMQVEMMQAFANGMERTPWYRFPFGRFLSLYFDVLWREVRVVADRWGWKAAVLSQAFAVDFVPGLVMGAVFAQLQALALPALSVGGAQYDDTRMIEELVVATPDDTPVDWTAIDPRIRSAMKVVDGLYVLAVPTFKPLTEVLLTIAVSLPFACVLEISQRKEVQVRLKILDGEEDGTDSSMASGGPSTAPGDREAAITSSLLRTLGGRMPHGCEIKFAYEYPTFGESGSLGRHVSVCVQVPHLLEALRVFSRHSGRISVAQVYDFFN